MKERRGAGVLAPIRSFAALLLLLLQFVLGGVIQRLLVWPATFVLPARRGDLVVGWFATCMAKGVFALVRLGGGRAQITGRIPSGRSGIVLMNHQSLLDIPAADIICRPFFPRFVTRRRYARFVPYVSLCVRLGHSPIVDPVRDPVGAIAALRRAPAEREQLFVLYPEGHRSRDGSLGEFETGGLRAALGKSRLPVHLIVADGYWRCRSVVDFAFGMHRIDGRNVVLGPFDPPATGDLRPFIADLHARMEAALEDLRRREP
jgi:1-acyl-sn-glycerol-3-phosphate acyltransferase